MLFGFLLTNAGTGFFNALLWGFLGALLIFGVGQLTYSILRALLEGAREWQLIIGAVILGAGVFVTPWTHPLTLLLLGLAGTAGLTLLYRNALKQKWRVHDAVPKLNQHVVIIDQEGRGLKLHPSYSFGVVPHFSPYTKEAFNQYIDKLLEAVENSSANRIVIFVHGGLTDYQDALLLSDVRRDAMMKEGIYPIFILWRSGLIPCYTSHLTEFRQGRMPLNRWYSQFALTLANIFADLGRGISRFPRTAYYQALNDLSALRPSLEHDALNAPQLYRLLRRRFQANTEGGAIRLRKKPDLQDNPSGTRRDVWLSDDWRLRLEILNPLKLAVRYTVWPLIDALGTSAWDIMLRRTYTLFRSPSEFDVFAGETGLKDRRPTPAVPPYAPELESHSGRTRYTQMLDTEPSGGLSLFIEAAMRRKLSAEVTLVGHSMGAIVVTRWLSLFPDYKAHEIVLMGAACTLQEG